MSKYDEIKEKNESFVRDLCLFLKNDKERFQSFMKSENEKVDYFENESVKKFEKYRVYIISKHAILNHSFSLFENFINKAIEIKFHNDEKSKSLIQSQWVKYCDKCKTPAVSSEILLDEKKQLKNLQHLRHFLKKDPESYLSLIIGADDFKDDDIQEHRANVYIYRQVRNCLTHRGNEFDKILLQKLFKGSPNFVKTSNAIKDFMSYQDLEGVQIPKNIGDFDREQLRGKKIYINITNIFRSLIFISTWYSIISTKLENDRTDILSPMGSAFHVILVQSEELKSSFLLYGCRQLFRITHKLIYKRNHQFLKDGDKFNYFLVEGLINDFLIKNAKSHIRYLRNSEQDSQKIENAEEILKKKRSTIRANKKQLEKFFEFEALPEVFKVGANSSDEFVDKNYTEINECLVSILYAHFNNKSDLYIDAIKHLPIEKKEGLDQMKSWYVMQKYKKNKKYLEMLKAKEKKLKN